MAAMRIVGPRFTTPELYTYGFFRPEIKRADRALYLSELKNEGFNPVSYTHLDVYKRQGLIRVMDPTGRVIPAKDFMPVVETHEIGRQIDCHALEIGLAALARVPDLRLSINMSARSIGYPRWKQVLRRGLTCLLYTSRCV